VVPIFETTPQSPGRTYRWICFAPTYKYRPFPTLSPFFTTTEPEAAPARGLILYSYHEAQSGPIPVEAVKRFGAWAKQRLRSANDPFGLLPESAATRYWQDNNADLKQLLGYLALGALVIGAVVLCIYLAPILFPEAALLAEAVTAPALATVARGAVLVEKFATVLPTTLALAQTALRSAINVGSNLQFVPAQP
jgi:hypothetical protein